MEEERKKRKIENNEEENEEEKMEKFFSLIKRTKDVRDRLYKEKSDNKKTDGALATTIWNPTFQPQDFIDCGDNIGRKSNININIISSGSHDHDDDDDAGPSEKDRLLTEKKQDVEEATPLATATQDNEEKHKETSQHLDLNLSL